MTLPSLTKFSNLSHRTVAATSAALLLLLSSLLMLPGRTFIGHYPVDIMGFWDGAYRVLQGQTPNINFHNPIGPLAIWFPAFGLWAGGTPGAMFPIATAAFAVLYFPLLAWTAVTRLPPLVAIAYVAWALILVIAPLNPGDPVQWMSFAMFYNRWGWAVLGNLFLIVLPARRRTMDSAVIAVSLLCLFYLKMTYAVVALIVLAASSAVVPESRRTNLLAGLLAASGLALGELLWRGTATYLSDIQLAGAASGALRGTLFTLGRVVVENLMPLLAYALVLLFAWLRGADRRILFLSVLMAGSGVFLINQNAQTTGIMALVPAALVAAFSKSDRTRAAELALIAVLAGPFMATHSLALAYHAVQASRHHETELDGLAAPDARSAYALTDIEPVRLAARDGHADISLVAALNPSGFPYPERLYLLEVHDGLGLLRRSGAGGNVVVLDMANPFNAAMGTRPPNGGDFALVEGRTFSTTHFRPAEDLFGDAAIIMDPKLPALPATNSALKAIYADYLHRHFRKTGESDYWTMWMR